MKSQIFRQAHQLAKTFTGDYRACFSLALKLFYREYKKFQQKKMLTEALKKIGVGFEFDPSHLNFAGKPALVLTGRTYPIKETLKKMGFRFINAGNPNWAVSVADESSALNIIKEII